MEKINFRELSNFFDKQQLALERTKVFDYLLYGGTLGGGKSRWIRWTALYWLLKWFNEYGIRGIRVGVFCEDYGSLNDRQLTYIKTEFPSWLGRYNEQRHEFKLEPEYGGGVIAFRNLDDADKYLSVEFALIAIDEINRNPFQTFNTLRRRLRWPGIEHTKFIGACNPIGEPWVTELWIDGIFPSELKSLIDQFHFVESRPEDNPYLSQKYYEDLKTQDSAFVEAALGGNWHAFDKVMDKDGYMKLLNPNEVSNAFTEDDTHIGIKVITIDPAAGGDESVICLKSDYRKEVLYNDKLEDTMALIPKIVSYCDHYKVDAVAIDIGGLGKPLFDRLKEKKKQGTLKVQELIGVNFGESSTQPTRFADIKAELYWKEREWILSGGKLVKHERWKEWSNIKYKIDSDLIIHIQSKQEMRKKGLPSPDVIDAGVISNIIDPKKIIKRKLNQSQRGEWVDIATEIYKS